MAVTARTGAGNSRRHPGTVVFLHAAGLDSRMWRTIERDMRGRGYHTQALDMPGHGEKPFTGTRLDLDDLAADVSRSIGHPPRPLAVVGLSLGGMVAQLAVASRPDGFDGLVLADTLCHPGEDFSTRLRERAARTRLVGAAGMVEETVARWFAPATLANGPAAVVSDVRNWLAEADTASNALVWEAIARFDGRAALQALDGLPTLVVHGEQDVATPEAYSRDIAGRLRRSRLVSMTGCGHMAPLENPLLFAQTVDDFLRSCDGEALENE